MIQDQFKRKMAKIWTFLIVNYMNCDKEGPQFWIIFHVEKGPNFSQFQETKRSKKIYFNDNVGPFLSKGDKNVDLFNREMVKILDLFNRSF